MAETGASASVGSPTAGGEVLVGTALKLQLGHCCHRELSWECAFERQAPTGRSVAERLPEALAPLGYVVAADRGFLTELTHEDGQCLVVVPRTGRVQLRLPYTTVAADRRELAQRLAAQIDRAVSALLETTG